MKHKQVKLFYAGTHGARGSPSPGGDRHGLCGDSAGRRWARASKSAPWSLAERSRPKFKIKLRDSSKPGRCRGPKVRPWTARTKRLALPSWPRSRDRQVGCVDARPGRLLEHDLLRRPGGRRAHRTGSSRPQPQPLGSRVLGDLSRCSGRFTAANRGGDRSQVVPARLLIDQDQAPQPCRRGRACRGRAAGARARGRGRHREVDALARRGRGCA